MSKNRARKEQLSLPEEFQKRPKLVDLLNSDIDKLEEKARLEGYKYLKPYLEDILHQKANS